MQHYSSDNATGYTCTFPLTYWPFRFPLGVTHESPAPQDVNICGHRKGNPLMTSWVRTAFPGTPGSAPIHFISQTPCEFFFGKGFVGVPRDLLHSRWVRFFPIVLPFFDVLRTLLWERKHIGQMIPFGDRIYGLRMLTEFLELNNASGRSGIPNDDIILFPVRLSTSWPLQNAAQTSKERCLFDTFCVFTFEWCIIFYPFLHL